MMASPAGNQWERRFPTAVDMLAAFGVEGQFDDNVVAWTFDFPAHHSGSRLVVTFRDSAPSFIDVTIWIQDKQVVDVSVDGADGIRVIEEGGARYLAATFPESSRRGIFWVMVDPHFAVRWSC